MKSKAVREVLGGESTQIRLWKLKFRWRSALKAKGRDEDEDDLGEMCKVHTTPPLMYNQRAQLFNFRFYLTNVRWLTPR